LIGYVEIPVAKLYSPLANYTGDIIGPIVTQLTFKRNQQIDYRVSFILYMISTITLVGTVFFVVFGGVGLAALPMDLVNAYRKRGKRIEAKVYAERKLLIGKHANAFLEKGRLLKERVKRTGGVRPKGRKDIQEYNRLRAATFFLEVEFKKNERAYGKGNGPVILYIMWEYAQLFLGVCGIAISLSWLLHIILYMAPKQPINPWLNNFFTKLDSAFGLFGTVAYGIWSFYLLFCVSKGIFKLGVRIPLICTIHPMKVGETLMNAFLFNAFILMLSALAIVKFCSAAFSAYASYTAIDIIFNVGVNNMRGFKYFWWYYYWVMVALAILTQIYLFINPSDQKAVNPDDEEKLPEIHV